ncbi:MAG: hypothetical protein WC453_00790 [Patescibacteria group bacterium]
MKKLFYLSIPILSLTAWPASAVCPVCVVAVGAGLGLSEYLGIDNTIAGLWIGGLLVSLTAWTINWLNKKEWSFGNKDLRDILVAVLYYGLTFWPLWSQNLIGYPNSRLWGADKIILGALIGSLAFLLMTLWYNRIKTRRGRPHFPYEKVALPVSALLILSFVFYFITRY